MKTGGCLCGAVRYEVDTIPDEDYRACHCTACRRSSGHYWSAFSVPATQFRLTQSRGLKWYASSDHAERGFCQDCGSSLFFRMHAHSSIEIAPGSVDGKTGLTLAGHIFVADKGDYYELNDGLPQWETS